MLKYFVTAFGIALLASVTPARADTQAYCELYAKDFADGRTSVVDQWQLSYRGAFDDCMTQYAATPDTAAPVVSQQPDPAPEPVAEPAPEPKAKPKPKVTKVAERKSKTTSAAKAASKKPVPGSDAWNAYCDAKYNSFNPQSGTYMSRSGKIRRCK